MKSLEWPYPSVIAGSLRSLLGKQIDDGFTPEIVKCLKEINIAGPLPWVDGELYFPAPKDLLIWTDEAAKTRHLMPLRPLELKKDEGCNLPYQDQGLSPVQVTGDVKPAKTPAFWSSTRMSSWLAKEECEVPPEPRDVKRESGFLNAPEQDERIHVKIEPPKGTAEEGMLFMTVGLDLTVRNATKEIALAVRVEAKSPWAKRLVTLNAFHPLGGERRLVHWQTDTAQTWDCPDAIRQALKGASRIRMLLATPGLFAEGWKPGWLDAELCGSPPGTSVCLKLVGACIERWQPLSGWNLEKKQPKPLRRLVSAGSVYFFKVLKDGDPSELAEKCWLRSVADNEPDQQNRHDGFGLALWGVWNKSEGSV
jgi:CRISPR-associated protein Cmr3